MEGRWEREFFIDNLLVRIYFIIAMIRWTGLAPWEFEFPFLGSLISTFLVPPSHLRSRFSVTVLRILYRGSTISGDPWYKSGGFQAMRSPGLGRARGSHMNQIKSSGDIDPGAAPRSIKDDRLRVGWLNGFAGPLWEGYRESRRCSRDTYPESYITKYTSIRRLTWPSN